MCVNPNDRHKKALLKAATNAGRTTTTETIMAHIAEKIKLTNYSASKPFIEYGGNDVEVEVSVEGEILNIYVRLEYDGLRDEVEIESIEAEMFDINDNLVDTSDIDLEDLVIDIFEKHNTFGEAERKMAEFYHDDQF